MGEFIFIIVGLGPLSISLLSRIAGYKLKQTYLFSVFVVLTLFSALRFQSGQDWAAYEDFFNQINLNEGFSDYFQFGSYSASQFEVGFFLVNYLTKLVSGSYFHVLALCSVVSGLSVYLFYKPIKAHTDFAIVSYIGYAYLILGFAQARQSLGLACFLFGLTIYLRKEKSIFYILGFSLIGITFQYSVAIYIVVAALAYFVTRFISTGRLVIVALFAIAVIVKNLNINIFQFFMIFAFNDTIAEKINIYEADVTDGGFLNLLYSILLLGNAVYIYTHSLTQTDFRLRFVLNLTATALYISFLIVFVLPGLYPLYSRVYLLGSICLPVAFYYVAQKKRTGMFSVLIAINYLALTISYFKIIYLFSDSYLPYTTWLFSGSSGI